MSPLGVYERHLAQINVGRLVAPIDDPRIAGFVAQLDPINALAEGSAGFVWRLKSDSGNATDIPFNDDPLVMVNMSVWETVEALKAFVYQSQHVMPMRDRRLWFEKMESAHACLWWVPEGHIPSVAEGRSKLEHYQQHGSTDEAFWFT